MLFKTWSQAAHGLGKGLVEQDARHVNEDIGAGKIFDGVVEYRLPAAMVDISAAIGTALATLGLIALTTCCAIETWTPLPSRGSAEIVYHARRRRPSPRAK